MKLYKKTTSELTKKDIREIISLKNSHWNFGFSSQLSWFTNKKNVFNNDLHFFLKKKKKIIAYVQLGKRKCYMGLQQNKYILFRTLIVSKLERGKNISQIIMNEVTEYVKIQKQSCFLLCKNKLTKFYKNYKFIKLDQKKYKVIGHKNYLVGMIYNLNKDNLKKNKKFFYNN